MEQYLEKTIKALKSNDFDVYYAENAEAVKDIVKNLIPVKATIGIGDSATLRQIGIANALQEDGRVMINPYSDIIIGRMNSGEITGADQMKYCRMALSCDYFITSTNVLTETGVLMNTDATGNRVAGMFFGPANSIMIIGRNKIVPDIEAGYSRLRNVCGVFHSKTKQRNNPCVKGGKCFNCKSFDRLCRVTTMIEKRPMHINANVILVDEDLGLGWDQAWDQARIDAIYEGYASVTKMKRPTWLNDQR